MALSLSPSLFSLLSAMIEARAGLHYGVADRELFAEKVSARALEQGFESLLDYYYFLRYDPGGDAELGQLIEVLTVNETYFFRELDQLQWLVDELLAPRCAAGLRPRLWSAACASGEEPLTVAMLLADRGIVDQVQIVASDLSERALARARRGVYPLRSLRQRRPALAARYLHPDEGRLVVAPELAAGIDWRRVNLVDDAEVAALGRFDVVLCRNVLIYFSDETARGVIGRLTRALRPGGALLIGISESLLRLGTALACEEHGGVFVYRPVAP